MDKVSHYLNQKNKKDWFIFLMLSGVVVCGITYCLWHRSSESPAVEKQEEIGIASSTQHVSLKKYFTEQIGKKIEEQEAHYNQAKEEIEQQNKHAQSEISLLKQDNQALHDALMSLKWEFEQAQQQNFDVRHEQEREPNIYLKNEPTSFEQGISVDEIDIVSINLEKGEDESRIPHASRYVTAGTHVKAVLLGGIDAHTEVYGKNETRVVTLRLIEEGIMPNNFKASLKNCVMLASAWGNASSERVVMQGERLSCIHDDGEVFEKDILGIVYGPDGREDVKGRVIYPEGKLVERAFIAGALSGLGSGIGEGFVSKSISPLGAVNSIDPGAMLNYGAAQGAHKSLDKLADYYIKRAEKLQPIVRVPAGVVVDVVFQKGFSLDFTQEKTATQVVTPSSECSINSAHEEALAVLGKFSESYHEE